MMHKTYLWFFQTIGRKGRYFYLMAIPIVFLMSLSEIVGIAVIVPFVCRVFGIETPSIPFLHYLNDINIELSLMGMFVLFAYLLKILINIGAVYVLNFLAFSIRNIFQRAYFAVFLFDKIESKIANSNGEGEAVRDLTYEFNVIHNQFIVSSLFLIAESFIVILLGSILLVYATQITLIMVLSLSIIIVCQNAIFSRRMYRWGAERARMDGQMANLAAYSVKGAKEIFVNQAENRVLNELSLLQNQYRNIGFKQVSTVSLPKYLIEAGAIASVIVFISINTEGSSTVVGELIMATVASLRLLPSFSKIAVSLQGIRGSLPSITRVYSNMRLARLPNTDPHGPQGIRLLVESKGLSYRYPATSREILIPQFTLSDVGLTSISGPSGSGKTTLFEIMLGMRDAHIGDARQVKFSSPILMAQQTHIFSSNIRGALTEYETGDVDEDWLNQVVTACGLEEIVARSECHGGDLSDVLSGGELNRLALARALIPRPKLLLLDEATNGLDLENRERIYQFLKEFSKNALVIMISHDEVLHDYADNIIALDAPERQL